MDELEKLRQLSNEAAAVYGSGGASVGAELKLTDAISGPLMARLFEKMDSLENDAAKYVAREAELRARIADLESRAAKASERAVKAIELLTQAREG